MKPFVASNGSFPYNDKLFVIHAAARGHRSGWPRCVFCEMVKEFTPGLASMKIGDLVELEADGRFATWIRYQAKRLNFRLVIRTQTPTKFLIIRTPLLGPKTVHDMVEQGLRTKEIARIFMSDPKTIRKLIAEYSSGG